MIRYPYGSKLLNSIKQNLKESLNISSELCTLQRTGKFIVHFKNCIRQRSTMVITKEKPSTFKFTNYDCIGFDLDNTLARFKVGAMIEMEYKLMATYLVNEKGYMKKHLLQPFDHNFILRGLFVDNENGNLLRVAPDGFILQAAHGTRMLKEEEIELYYPNRHWEASDIFCQNPLETWNGPYSEKMRTLLDYFDIAVSLVFARAVDTIDELNATKQVKYDVWPDLLECLQCMFNRDYFQTGEGGYFREIKTYPEKYYNKCSNQLLMWLKDMRSHGKKLFLITGSHVDFVSFTASNTLGPNWRDYFDLVVCYAKKPGFFTMKRDFLQIDGFQEGDPICVNDLKLGGIYTHGNWAGLRQFLEKQVCNPHPKFLYIGDNLVQDIVIPNVYVHCDTVTICEEMEAEGVLGHQQWHPDQHFLTSTIWGSYFHCNNTSTNWHHLMKKHSKLCVPSLEYIAALPIDHEFVTNNEE